MPRLDELHARDGQGFGGVKALGMEVVVGLRLSKDVNLRLLSNFCPMARP